MNIRNQIFLIHTESYKNYIQVHELTIKFSVGFTGRPLLKKAVN